MLRLSRIIKIIINNVLGQGKIKIRKLKWKNIRMTKRNH